MTFERIKYFYDAGLWNKAMVRMAVKKGVITMVQYSGITGEDVGDEISSAEALDILLGGTNV